MKRLLVLLLLIIAIVTIPTSAISSREEAEGKEIWEKLQAKHLECKNLVDNNFGALGEYFMGQMMGDSHESMNTRLIRMLGEKGEEQMHVAMGKRISDCEPNAPMPQSTMNGGMMTMMMGGGGNPMMGYGSWNNMMGGWGSFGFLGWIFMIIFWVLIILGVIALIRYLVVTGQRSVDKGKTPLEILKERYAKGEIDKKEFEEKKLQVK